MSEEKKEELNEEKVDVKGVIKTLGDMDWEKEQGKAAQLLRGLAFAEDPLSDEFMKKLSSASTGIANKMLKEETEEEKLQKIEESVVNKSNIYL